MTSVNPSGSNWTLRPPRRILVSICSAQRAGSFAPEIVCCRLLVVRLWRVTGPGVFCCWMEKHGLFIRLFSILFLPSTFLELSTNVHLLIIYTIYTCSNIDRKNRQSSYTIEMSSSRDTKCTMSGIHHSTIMTRRCPHCCMDLRPEEGLLKASSGSINNILLKTQKI